MKNLMVSATVEAKLQQKHFVTIREVEQCFYNREGRLLFDTRTKTKTNPPTLWFIALTNKNRSLKVVYIQKDQKLILKTAYEPNDVELAIYARYGTAA